MNKTKVIIFSSLGLAIILVIFLFVNAGHKKNDIAEDSEAMTEVQQEFTYKDMMEARSSKENYSDTTEARPLTTTAPADVEAPVTPGQTQNEPDLSQEVAVIKEVKDSIKVQAKRSNTITPRSNTQIQQEDEYLRQYAANNNRHQRESRQPEAEPIESSVPEVKAKPKKQASTQEPFKSSMKFTYNKPGEGQGSGRTDIKAEIMKEVVVKDNETVSLMLLETASVNGVALQKSKVLTGVTRISGNRVFIHVPGANVDGHLSNLKFSVYDNDGLEGLRVAGLDRGEAGEQVKEQGISAAGGIGGGIVNSVVSVVRAFGTKGHPKIMLAEGRVMLKSVSLN